jgi:GrpB-like predicted nucleotidyltransferase (UPF0157 family)
LNIAHRNDGALTILTYRLQPPAYREYDPEAPAVAQAVIALIREKEDHLQIEHIGSTAVPNCAGKGYIDLLVLYPAGLLDAAKQALDALGFQRQQGREPFPEDRPMRTAVVKHRGRDYPVHAHVVAADASEAAVLLKFRDRLRADPALRLAYETEKQRILGTGVTDPSDYANAKDDFVRDALL